MLNKTLVDLPAKGGTRVVLCIKASALRALRRGSEGGATWAKGKGVERLTSMQKLTAPQRQKCSLRFEVMAGLRVEIDFRV